MGRPGEALSDARLAVELDPGNSDSQTVLGMTLAGSGEFGEAIAAFERALKMRPSDPVALRGLAAALADVEDPRSAQVYDNAIAAAPRDLPLRVEFAESCWRAYDFVRGNQQMERVLRLKPDDPAWRVRYAVSLGKQARLAQSIEQLEAARHLDPDNADVLFYLGTVLHEVGRFDEAELRLRQAVRKAPGLTAAHHRLGKLLLARGKAGEAAAELTRAAELAPESADIELDLRSALDASGDLPRAEQAYRRALEWNPAPSRAHYLLGTLLAREGRKDEAAEHIAIYQEAFRKEQDQRFGLGSRAVELFKGQALLKEKRYAEALAQFQRRPDDVDALRGCARALAGLGRYQEAIRPLERARLLDPNNRAVLYQLDQMRARIRRQ